MNIVAWDIKIKLTLQNNESISHGAFNGFHKYLSTAAQSTPSRLAFAVRKHVRKIFSPIVCASCNGPGPRNTQSLNNKCTNAIVYLQGGSIKAAAFGLPPEARNVSLGLFSLALANKKFKSLTSGVPFCGPNARRINSSGPYNRGWTLTFDWSQAGLSLEKFIFEMFALLEECLQKFTAKNAGGSNNMV